MGLVDWAPKYGWSPTNPRLQFDITIKIELIEFDPLHLGYGHGWKPLPHEPVTHHCCVPVTTDGHALYKKVFSLGNPENFLLPHMINIGSCVYPNRDATSSAYLGCEEDFKMFVARVQKMHSIINLGSLLSKPRQWPPELHWAMPSTALKFLEGYFAHAPIGYEAWGTANVAEYAELTPEKVMEDIWS